VRKDTLSITASKGNKYNTLIIYYLAVGLPAKVIRNLTEKEKVFIKENALHYIELGKENKK
jgi:carbonic anhydrase/acetyltransferase-like protein (isoleucine patch superfamily)